MRSRVKLLDGDLFGAAEGGTADSLAVSTVPADDSVFDSLLSDADDLLDGIRNHRNFGDAEEIGSGRGWKGGQKTGLAGVMAGVLVRNLDAPVDGTKNNNVGAGKKLAERFRAPTPGTVTVDLPQIAMRLAPNGTPAVTTIAIQADAAGLPSGITLFSATINPADSVNGFVYVNIGATLLTPGNHYWIVMDTLGAVANHWLWSFVNSSTATEFAAEFSGAGPWVAQTYRLHYRTIFDWTGQQRQERINTFFDSQRVNRIRIYSYPSSRTVTGQGIEKFKIYWRVGGVYVAATGVTVKASDYGNAEAAVVVVGNDLTSSTASFFDISTDTVTADSFRIEILRTQTGFDFARLIAIEGFETIDITDRVLSYDMSLKRDTFFEIDQARYVSMGCWNGDRFFSPQYLPTSAQVTAGFRNADMRPDLEVQIEEGFPSEMVPIGTFYLDKITVAPRGRRATLPGRDFQKYFDGPKLSESEFRAARVEDLIELMGNRANWSSSRMVLAKTESFVPFFFPAGTTIREEIEELAEAAPFATVRFDEVGTMRMISFLPSTSAIGPFQIGSNLDSLDVGDQFRSHALISGEKAYFSALEPAGGVQNVEIIEYDIPTRAVRVILSQPFGVDDELFSHLTLDGAGNFYCARHETLYKVNLTTLAVTSLLLTTVIATFNNVSFLCDRSEIVSGIWYFAGLDNIIAGTPEKLFRIATSLAGGTLVTIGAIQPGTALLVSKIMRWNPSVTLDRLMFSWEPGTAPTNTHYNLLTAALGSDGVNRIGVTTDGTLLYEQTSGNVLRSRTEGGTLVTLDPSVPAKPGNQNGVGIGFAAGRIWQVRRDASLSHNNILRVTNPLDLSIYEQDLAPGFQRSIVAEDYLTGRIGLVEQDSETVPPFRKLYFRVIQGPNAPVAESITVAWNTELLEAQYEKTSERGGQSIVLTGIRWIFNPVILGVATTVWRMTQNGQELSTSNTFLLPVGTDIDLSEGDVGGPAYKPGRRRAGSHSIVDSDFAGFICPTNTPGATATGTSVSATTGITQFGAATSHALPAGEPSIAIPQHVVWSGTGGQMLAFLYPHPTSPRLLLRHSSGADVTLSRLEIRALPYFRAGMQVVEVLGTEVLSDGALILTRHGENVKEIQNDYISDTTLLKLAATEALRLLGRPQIQFTGVEIRPSPQIGLEDLARCIEPESGVDMKFLIVGIGQSFSGGKSSPSVKTTMDLLALPVTSTQGFGQVPNPPPAQFGPVSD
jgi:hypothetical protein